MPSIARLLPILLALGVAFALSAPATAGKPVDAESASHSDQAAIPQVSFEERLGDTVIRQYQLGCLSQLTYLVGSDGEGAVVDPQRDIGHYLEDAKALGLKITKVFLTHTNADFVAGHTEMAARTGATIYIAKNSESAFPHEALEDGDKVELGKATLEFWATPGHTMDSMTILVHAPAALVDPAWAITGDTLFIGGIGRPDLIGGDITPVVLANKAYDSMQRLSALPDGTKVLPAHGAGSLCGAHLSPETVSTMGEEKKTNPYLSPMSRAKFVSRIVSGLPVAPAYFKENVRINREGPPVIDEMPDMPPALSPADVQAQIDGGAWVIDLRDAATYAAEHVKGSVNIAVRGRLDTWTGIVVPFDAPLVLVGNDEEVREAAFRFRRIGLDRVEGYLAGGVKAWTQAGMPVRTTGMVTPKALAARIAAGTEPVIVDVRTAPEFAEARLGDYANLPLSDWRQFGQVLDPTAPVLFACNSAYRSSMAVGLAERQGFDHVLNLDGGLEAWLDAGLSTKGTAQLHGGAAPLALPEPMEPSALATALLDRPRSYAVLDIRPAWQYEEYHVPGAMNLAPEAVAEYVRTLPTTLHVVIVDRDGTTGFAVAGQVMGQIPERALRVLTGGTARFWHEIEAATRGGMTLPASTATPATTPTATPGGASQHLPPPPAKRPARRSAGC